MGKGWGDAVKVMIWGKIGHELGDRTGRIKWFMQEWQQTRSWVFSMETGVPTRNPDSKEQLRTEI